MASFSYSIPNSGSYTEMLRVDNWALERNVDLETQMCEFDRAIRGTSLEPIGFETNLPTGLSFPEGSCNHHIDIPKYDIRRVLWSLTRGLNDNEVYSLRDLIRPPKYTHLAWVRCRNDFQLVDDQTVHPPAAFMSYMRGTWDTGLARRLLGFSSPHKGYVTFTRNICDLAIGFENLEDRDYFEKHCPA